MSDPATIAAILRRTPPEPYATSLAAGLMAEGLMRTNRPMHWAVRFCIWRTKCDPRRAWRELFTRIPGIVEPLLQAAADHCEAGGFDEVERLRLAREIGRIVVAMEKAG